jgi:hypothetical protein
LKELEVLIIGAYVHVPDFYHKTNSKIKPELFESNDAKTVFGLCQTFWNEQKIAPTQDALLVELKSARGISQESVNDSSELIRKLFHDDIIGKFKAQNLDWLINKTKSYLTDRSCYLAIMESLDILDPSSKTKKTADAIPELLMEALSIDFDSDVGHDYIANMEDRLKFYHNDEERVPFSLSMLNRVLGGAMPKRSLVVPISGTGVGKSLFMTDQAAFHITNGRNVLYISLEMAAEKIAERVDSKLMEIPIWDVSKMSDENFRLKFQRVMKSVTGRLIVKAYAPGTFHSNHLRSLLIELKQKENFIPDVVCVDYLGLMASYRMKADTGSYGYLKACSEELRGVALENNYMCISPMQVNRGGLSNTDPELDSIADSMGVAHTADLIFVMVGTPEMDAIGLVRFKLLKNRNGSMTNPNSWTVGIDRAKMTMYDADMSAQPTNAIPPPQKADTKKLQF